MKKVKINNIKFLKRDKVVDITVKKNNTFILSNGIVTHNSERISPQGQDSLKDLIESVRNITRFFFLTNNENKVTDAIKSRCGYHIDLNDPPAKDIYNRCLHILSNEGVELENKKALVEMIKKLYPDIRKTIGTLQSNVFDGKVKNISFSTTEDMFKSIFTLMIEKDIENLRKKLKSNYIDYDDLYKFLYREIIEDPDKVKKPGDFIIQTAEYMFRNTTVASGEVNFMGYFFSLMYTEAI